MRVRVHIWAPAPGSGTLDVSGEWGEQAPVQLKYPAGHSNMTVHPASFCCHICRTRQSDEDAAVAA